MLKRLQLWWLGKSINLHFWCRPSVRYFVITKLPENDDGNLCDEIMEWREFPVSHGSTEVEKRIGPAVSKNYQEMFFVRTPVFSLGEVLIVNRHGREIVGEGRKPAKWNVEYETFWTLRAALKRAKQVLDEC